MIFTNASVAKKYEPAVVADRSVHLPCCYSGLLSNIPLCAADKLYADGSNLLRLKEPEPAPPADPEEA